ncbi:uncharacterized protein TM35_000341560 [Trypanosoma theileri]|uniref:Uncharacterized protein n=1 Tax=Trypanosoma theileri TaxID=67003 RepID=A0A1X0NLA1_9TRYP|nr:uncharacterized protein TM35_000341560 [Trypanosoma theileri]ORC85544.1 hypothetical protein TM35_000341560 [Trypanosoma theileri]
MSLSSSSATSSCANKREVLNRVKEILEKYVQSSVIDREDIKDLAKKSTEAVTPPAAVEEVNRATLQQLITFLQECNTDEAVISSVRADLEAQTSAIALAAKKDEEREGQKGNSAPAVPAFSLSSFQERMARKKEELRRQREEALSTVEETSRADAPVVTATSTPATTTIARGTTSNAPSVSADEDEPRVRRHKVEVAAPVPVLLPLLHDEADLYAGLVADTDTRGRGGWQQ